MKAVVLIQPPFVQLNSPYPSLYYLRAFLEKQGRKVTVRDHSIGLFERIFCQKGLERIFEDVRKMSVTRRAGSENPHIRHMKSKVAFPKTEVLGKPHIIERFLSEETLWLSSIDRLVNFLRCRDREWGHFLTLANGCLPGGPRFDAALEEWGGEAPPDSAGFLASKLLADLADFITTALDPSFSLIRYVPVLSASSPADFKDFEAVRKNLKGYLMEHFYRPFLEEEWDRIEPDGPFLLGVTIPFPGCLAGALVCAESAKARFGDQIVTAAGGGYVNTELRFTEVREFKTFFDHLSLDRGYGFLASLLEGCGKEKKALKTIDDEAAANIFPDYTGVDFSRYICPVDDANPMHRLWSDGRWLKAYLAHGCYWHSCAFCDVTLDYIREFIPVDPEAFFFHIKEQAEKTGVRGVHLVDEAAPVSSLLRLALLNRDKGLPVNLWGNIRFEKNFTSDIAAVLAAGGLTGVSAGIEVAVGAGLKRMGKGIVLEDVAGSCAAFKEAGILTHGYLIFGYWDQDEQEIIDSAEVVRQLFVAGLLDSAFWHKFILTRHSRLYAEKARGLHQGLRIRDDDNRPDRFALNDLSFEGEEKFDKYAEPLDRLLSLWMSGDVGCPITAAFPFKVKKPSVSPDLVRNLLDGYARNRDRERGIIPGQNGAEQGKNRILFLGSRPVVRKTKQGAALWWRWRLEDRLLTVAGGTRAEALADLLTVASGGNGIDGTEFAEALENITGRAGMQGVWKILRESGLVVLPSNSEFNITTGHTDGHGRIRAGQNQPGFDQA
jgi:radical SAM superfamily enzyme YgiQ (UPF0313 family)